MIFHQRAWLISEQWPHRPRVLSVSQIQMPSGNKIIGHAYYLHMHLEIYISSKTVTQGLCGSFDNIAGNDLFDRNTRQPWVPENNNDLIDVNIADSWR